MAGSAALKFADQKKANQEIDNSVTQCLHGLVHHVSLISTTQESEAVYVPEVKLELLTAVGHYLVYCILSL